MLMRAVVRRSQRCGYSGLLLLSDQVDEVIIVSLSLVKMHEISKPIIYVELDIILRIVRRPMISIRFLVYHDLRVLLVFLMCERMVPVRYNVKQKPRTVALEDLHMILDSQQSVIVINIVF